MAGTRSRQRAGSADAAAAAPLAPPDTALDTQPDTEPVAAPASQAAPLAPPAEPAPPAPEPGPAPAFRTVATPGAVVVDYKFGDTRQPADPDDLWVDPGRQYTYVQAKHSLIKVVKQEGARQTSTETLMCPAGEPYDRARAEEFADELRQIRARQAGGQ